MPLALLESKFKKTSTKSILAINITLNSRLYISRFKIRNLS